MCLFKDHQLMDEEDVKKRAPSKAQALALSESTVAANIIHPMLTECSPGLGENQ
jgi:hypothetical protein